MGKLIEKKMEFVALWLMVLGVVCIGLGFILFIYGLNLAWLVILGFWLFGVGGVIAAILIGFSE